MIGACCVGLELKIGTTFSVFLLSVSSLSMYRRLSCAEMNRTTGVGAGMRRWLRQLGGTKGRLFLLK